MFYTLSWAAPLALLFFPFIFNPIVSKIEEPYWGKSFPQWLEVLTSISALGVYIGLSGVALVLLRAISEVIYKLF